MGTSTSGGVLVPINQIGTKWVQPFDKSQFPDGFTMEPEKLMGSREGRLRLVDVLPPDAYEVFNVTVPPGTSRHNTPGGPGTPATCELPVSADRLWSISIVDEGPPVPGIDHRKFDLLPTRNAFLGRAATGKVATGQLTAPKLERLMDRYAGKEWLPSRLKHLDFPASEREDVVRGLRTYVLASQANARRFAELYSQLPSARRMMGADVVKAMEAAKTSR